MFHPLWKHTCTPELEPLLSQDLAHTSWSFPQSTLDEQGLLFAQKLDVPGTNQADSTATKRSCRSCSFHIIDVGYFRSWFDAPANDLALLKNLKAYASINSSVFKVACTKFLNHLWYLSEEDVALAFFGDSIAERRKQRMVKNLAKPGNCSHVVKVKLMVETIEGSGMKTLCH